MKKQTFLHNLYFYLSCLGIASIFYLYSVVERALENDRYTAVVSYFAHQSYSTNYNQDDIRESIFLLDKRTGKVMNFHDKIKKQYQEERGY